MGYGPHRSLLSQGADAVRAFVTEQRKTDPSFGLDLTDDNLSNRELRGFCFSQANLAGANFSRSDLRGADLSGANLTKATFDHANLEKATLDGAVLSDARFDEAIANGAIFTRVKGEHVRFMRAQLTHADFSGTTIKAIDVEQSNAQHAKFDRCSFHMSARNADLRSASFRESHIGRSNFDKADLSNADVWRSDFYEVQFENTICSGLVNAEAAKNLETTRGHATYFETCQRKWSECWAGWEQIRTIGNLKIFTVSYTVMILLLSYFTFVGLYNARIDIVKDWADEQVKTPDKISRPLAKKVQELAHPWHVRNSTMFLVVSIPMLLIASGLYTWFCPDVIKDFTRSNWLYALNRELVVYWAYSWKHRWARVSCFWLYWIGGPIFVLASLAKFIGAVGAIWNYMPWFG